MSLLKEATFRIGLRLMCLVRPFFVVEIDAGISRIIVSLVVFAFFFLKTFVAGPGVKLRAIHGEMLVGNQARLISSFQYFMEKFLGNLSFEKPLPIFRKYRFLPDAAIGV